MRGHRILTESEKFGTEFKEKERARGIEYLKNADSFIVLTNKDGHNHCVSACEGDSVPQMAFNCHKIEAELLQTMQFMFEQWKKGEKDG